MNYKKLDKNWKEFAKKENAELVCVEKEMFSAIRCEYILTLRGEFYKAKIVGTFWKSLGGNNRNSTVFYIKYINRDSSQSRDINDRIVKSLFVKNEEKYVENNVYRSFKKIDGIELKLFKDLLRFELNKIISKHSEFEEIYEIINEINNYKS